MMNDEINLITTITSENAIGDVVTEQIKTNILCEVESVTRSEFYNAAKIDMQPEIVFIVNRYDYEGQSEIEYENKLYDVIRSYKPNNQKGMDIDRLELICKGADIDGDA